MTYVQGCVSQMEQSLDDFRQLVKKMQIEENNEKVCQYTLNMAPVERQESIRTDCWIEDLEDIENIDLNVIYAMIAEGQFSFMEAIVLMIRERALLIDNQKTGGEWSNQSYEMDEESGRSLRSKSVNGRMSVSLQKMVNRLVFRHNNSK